MEDFLDQENNLLSKVSYNESALVDWNRASEYQHHHLYELSKQWPTAHYWMTISRLYHDTYSGNISAGYIIALIVAACLILSSFWTNV